MAGVHINTMRERETRIMKYCIYCGTKIDDDDVYCLNCGRVQDDDGLAEIEQKEKTRALNDDIKVSYAKTIVTTGVIAVCVCAIVFVGLYIITGNNGSYHSWENNNEYHYSGTDAKEDYNGYEYDYDRDYSDCVFPYSSQAYIDETEAYYLTDDELQEAINELYARHGRIFDDEEIQAYFSSKSWYVPVAREIEKEYFNGYEEYNWEILTKERKAREPDYD